MSCHLATSSSLPANKPVAGLGADATGDGATPQRGFIGWVTWSYGQQRQVAQ